MKLDISGDLLLPFLNDKNNFHNQVSAARAMRAIKTEENKIELLNAIADTTKRNFVRVMCVWSLSELKPKGLKVQLQKIEESTTDERDGFGGNIMDPRICTRVPTLKEALIELIDKL